MLGVDPLRGRTRDAGGPALQSRRDHRHRRRPHVGVLPHRELHPRHGRARAHPHPSIGERDLHRPPNAGTTRSRAGSGRRPPRRDGEPAATGRLGAGARAATADHHDLRAARGAVRGPRAVPRVGQHLHDVEWLRRRGAARRARAAHRLPRRTDRQPARGTDRRHPRRVGRRARRRRHRHHRRRADLAGDGDPRRRLRDHRQPARQVRALPARQPRATGAAAHAARAHRQRGGGAHAVHPAQRRCADRLPGHRRRRDRQRAHPRRRGRDGVDRVGQPRRVGVPARRSRRHRTARHLPTRLRARCPLLSRRAPGARRAAGGARVPALAVPRPAPGGPP